MENFKYQCVANNRHLVDWYFSFHLSKFFKLFLTVFWTANGVGTDLNGSLEQPFMLMMPHDLKMI